MRLSLQGKPRGRGTRRNVVTFIWMNLDGKSAKELVEKLYKGTWRGSSAYGVERAVVHDTEKLRHRLCSDSVCPEFIADPIGDMRFAVPQITPHCTGDMDLPEDVCVDFSRSWLADAVERGTSSWLALFNSRLAARSNFSTESTRISQTCAEWLFFGVGSDFVLVPGEF